MSAGCHDAGIVALARTLLDFLEGFFETAIVTAGDRSTRS